jgi:alkylhydroperoxidase family enzyme
MTRNRRIPLPPGGARLGAAYQPALSDAIDGFYRSATQLRAVDPVITELVRLRCARYHDCRICQAVRLRDARAAGVDEAVASSVDRYEESTLEERAMVALRYVDAFISGPPAVEATLAVALRTHFTPAQVVELSLDIMKFSTQKIHVTLGVDVMPGVDVDSGAVTFFEFDGEGQPVRFVSSEHEPSPTG